MPVPPPTLDALLHLGEQIADAVEEEEWTRLSDLVERRAEAVHRLAASADGRDAFAGQGDTLDALAQQHQHLAALLHERCGQIEEDLAQIEHTKTAHDAYDAPAPPVRVLNAKLSG